MRTLLLAGAAALTLTALPAALNAQQSANQANAQNQPAPATTTVITTPAEPARTTVVTTPAQPAQTTIVTNNPGNLTAVPQSAMNKTYPVCTRTLQDSCQNPGEGGAPGKSRALGYWPGEPASERTDRGG
jgi:hypothetical protein